jgi:peptidoglycan LD-endopeptidase LytH
MKTNLRSLYWLLLLLVWSGRVPAARIEFVWPTPNKAFAQGRDIEAFVQPTVSGDPESGLFGCVRSGGTQFHEGLDLKPVARDRRGEAADEIFAAMDGVVRYVNTKAGTSSYGRYVIIEHAQHRPAVFTLYAHLARVESGVRVGASVRAGQVIALMGRSAGGYAIPKERAHLHFEIGLRVTDSFNFWYQGKKFGNPNEHGVWNGMNLMGIDPLDFVRQLRAGRVEGFEDYFQNLPTVVRVRVYTNHEPDFIRRYPSLLEKPRPPGFVGGWELACTRTGLPVSWKPLSPSETAGRRHNSVEIVSVDAAAVRKCRCKSLVKARQGADAPGEDLRTLLSQLFGIP